MTTIPSPSIRQQVDRQFRQLHARRGDFCNNPITGAPLVWGLDNISEQKRNACRALVACAWHTQNSPGAPPLPVHAWDIAAAKTGGDLSHLLAYFAESVACGEWRLSGHPPFEVYAQGVLASPKCPRFFTQDENLVARFPPRPIYGLKPGFVYVRPSKSTHH
jgi:hypothetical protein